MFKFKRISALMCAALLLYGCEKTDDKTPYTSAPEAQTTAQVTEEATQAPITEAEPVQQAFAADEEHVRLIGRTFFDDTTGVRWLTYSASGIEFEFSGTDVELVFYGDSKASTLDENSGVRYAVYIDDEPKLDAQMVKKGADRVTVHADSSGTHNLKLIKLSEVANSIIGVKQITVMGDIKPAGGSDRLIEFIGDSITCGYGVDDEDRTHPFSTSTEDATKAYGYRTAQLLGWDCSLVAISGHGIVSGYTGNGVKQDKQLMSDFYGNHGHCYGTAGANRLENVAWDFARQPDVIVINLGTNDESYTKRDEERIEEYTLGYVDFLKLVRGKNPDAAIICALGLMGDGLYPAVCDAVSRYSAGTGDENVYTFHFDPIKADEGYAADYHPTSKTHERAAAELAEYIESIKK